MRLLLIAMMLVFGFTAFAAGEFSRQATGTPEIIQTGENKMWCPVCGMNLKMFYKTSHALKLHGGQNRQYCSLRCMLEDYEGISTLVQAILVVDNTSEKLIDARKAFYVVGSKAPGTMSSTSKYAFAKKEDALKFQAEMGGEIMDFSHAAQSAKVSMQKDINMTNMKREKMMYPKGKMIFDTACRKSIDPMQFNLINEMKAYIHKSGKCGKLAEPELQAVTLYLWDVVRKQNRSEEFITVKETDKCPVCGMFVYKYPKWAAKITYSKNSEDAYAAFDGVKDMLKFYFNPAKWGDYGNINVKSVMVSDYYTNKAVDAKKAYYVAGSDVYGPMGRELIPFADRHSAETFRNDHSGEAVLTFEEITEKTVYMLDE
jgi:nitrous oxide reductase accessory protein NosL